MRTTQLIMDAAQPRDVMAVRARRWRTGRGFSCYEGNMCECGEQRVHIQPTEVQVMKAGASHHQHREVRQMVAEAVGVVGSPLLRPTSVHLPLDRHRI